MIHELPLWFEWASLTALGAAQDVAQVGARDEA